MTLLLAPKKNAALSAADLLPLVEKALKTTPNGAFLNLVGDLHDVVFLYTEGGGESLNHLVSGYLSSLPRFKDFSFDPEWSGFYAYRLTLPEVDTIRVTSAHYLADTFYLVGTA